MANNNGGARTMICPICKQMYKRSNWMIRKGPGLPLLPDGAPAGDTHQIACLAALSREQPDGEEQKSG